MEFNRVLKIKCRRKFNMIPEKGPGKDDGESKDYSAESSFFLSDW